MRDSPAVFPDLLNVIAVNSSGKRLFAESLIGITRFGTVLIRFLDGPYFSPKAFCLGAALASEIPSPQDKKVAD
jgi:hypothetical protein